MTDPKAVAREIVAKHPGYEQELLLAASDAIDLSDCDSTHLFFVCDDMIEVLNEQGVDISTKEFVKLCRAMIDSGEFDD